MVEASSDSNGLLKSANCTFEFPRGNVIGYKLYQKVDFPFHIITSTQNSSTPNCDSASASNRANSKVHEMASQSGYSTGSNITLVSRSDNDESQVPKSCKLTGTNSVGSPPDDMVQFPEATITRDFHIPGEYNAAMLTMLETVIAIAVQVNSGNPWGLGWKLDYTSQKQGYRVTLTARDNVEHDWYSSLYLMFSFARAATISQGACEFEMASRFAHVSGPCTPTPEGARSCPLSPGPYIVFVDGKLEKVR